MKDIKKVGLTALAGSLAAISANAAEMSVSGATLLTYTSEDPSEVTGNPWGMKTNLAFTASGDVNGYTVSYYQASQDQFAGMSSASLSIDLGDMGKIRFDQGAGSGLGNIDDKTPTAAEEIWDGLDGTKAGGLVGQGNAGAWNYTKSLGDVAIDYAYVSGPGGSAADGATSVSDGDSAWGLAVTFPVGDSLAMGVGFGQVSNANNDVTTTSDDEHRTVFANYTMGAATFGYQISRIEEGKASGTDENTDAWGIAWNVNDNLSVSYGERTLTYDKPGTDVDEDGEGIAVAYTMGSVKIAGNHNEVTNNGGTAGSNDEMTEIALVFSF
jgi:outer membrane protein OmpU